MSGSNVSKRRGPSGSDKAPLSKARKIGRFLCFAMMASLLCVVLGLVGVICVINTSFGRQFVERQVPSLTGGMVDISGFSGRFPTKISLAHLNLRDKQGVWFTADRVTLRWHPLALLHMRVKIDDVQAQSVSLSRMPVSDEAAVTTSDASASSPGYLHLAIRLRRLDVLTLEIGAPLAGMAARFSVQGQARITNLAQLLDGVDPGHLPKLQLGLNVTRLDQPGHLRLCVKNASRRLNLHLDAADPANAFLARLITQPRAVPFSLNLDAAGPHKNLAATLDAKFGDGRIAGQALLNLPARKAKLDLDAHIGAMQFASAAGWQSLTGSIHLHGPFLAPLGQGEVTINRLTSAAAQMGRVNVRFDGHAATSKAEILSLRTQIDQLRVNALPTHPFEADPIIMNATFQPTARGRPVHLKIAHRIFQINGDAETQPSLKGHITYALPDLSPFAALAALKMAGHLDGKAQFAWSGTSSDTASLMDDTQISISEAPRTWEGMVQGLTKLHLSLKQKSESGKPVYHLDDLAIMNPHLNVQASGSAGLQPGQKLQLGLKVKLPQLKNAAPDLRGYADLDATLDGKIDDFSLSSELKSAIGLHKAADGHITLSTAFKHLPSRPEGFVKASGTLDSAPLDLVSHLASDENGGHHFTLERLTWRGVKGHADMRLGAHKIFPVGNAQIEIADLNHFSALAGQALAGRAALKVATQDGAAGHQQHVDAVLNGRISSPSFQLGGLNLTAYVTDPETNPKVSARLKLDQIKTGTITGAASAQLSGPPDDLHLNLRSHFDPFFGADLDLSSDVTADLTKQLAHITKLNAHLKDDALRLTKPLLVTWGARTGADNISLSLAKPGMAPASLTGHAFISPKLSVQMALKNLRPAFASPFASSLDIDGVLSATAQLEGSTAAPQGRVSLLADHLHALSGDAAALPSATIKAIGDIKGDNLQLQASARAGNDLDMRVEGTAPLSATGNLNLATRGQIDLRIADAITGAGGMAVQGRVMTDLQAKGTVQKPQISGAVTLKDVAFSGYAQGLSVHGINGRIVSVNNQLVLQDIVGRAGEGEIGISGSVGVLEPGMPLDISVNARKARPISSELITAVIDASLRAKGKLSEAMDLSGKVKLDTVTVNIPDSVPASIPKLNVIWPNQKVSRDAAQGNGGMKINLDLEVASPGSFYVRGHGLDAEMMGTLHINGTAASPNIEGSFDMRRGYFNLAGVNLNFSHGVVGFNGSGVEHQLDPSLDFRADRNVQGTTASLVVSGYASAPKIDFTSSPSFPRDQVLAMLLFGSMTPQLTTSQMASLATALAQIAGGSGGFDPLTKIRGLLGLDRLAVGGGSGVADGGASVEAGKYITKGVYVGAKQATQGSGTQAQVQVDLTKRLKLNTTVGTGGQITGFTTPENDPGSSVGLSYGLDY
ncbi:translocation/assembly module TamB domain-containing protein [Candidatus Kirkpatrickella diaphorinae]|uniref:Translocation/assembly module TamB domain-containing protein n=2 Tax=Acetobacteraceae TaxID=433 RepID=A0ABY6GKH6_9PROT|nr:translocation/assembly module TamB domain-containing protein [Candidatus Kirkpatrickella diaphorinae]UYH52039.1 translocation/assembly module TamB domain-containing protein [Candidatus Kirkpatrickella diaphorinae]